MLLLLLLREGVGNQATDHKFPCAVLQTSHEVHTARLDALEDRLVGKEISAANALADKNNTWQEQRHRCAQRNRLCSVLQAKLLSEQLCVCIVPWYLPFLHSLHCILA
jgi:hypothetical protein